MDTPNETALDQEAVVVDAASNAVNGKGRHPGGRTASVTLQITLIALIAVGTWLLLDAVEGLEEAVRQPVTVANPVTEVAIINQVETVAPKDASLYGYCNRSGDGGYRISVTAISGGTEKTVAEGLYTQSAAEFLGLELSQYYGLPELFFGDSSDDCSHLQGWG